MKKSELKRLIKEVIQERWINLFGAPEEKEPGPIDKLYSDSDKWADDMLDDGWFYIGSELYDNRHEFKKREYIGYSPEKHLRLMMVWNNLFAKKNGIDSDIVKKFNDKAQKIFDNRYELEDLIAEKKNL